MTSLTAPLSRPRSFIVFFVLAFGISWVAWVPTALASYGLLAFQPDLTVSGLLGAFGPFLATLITTTLYDGRAGFRTLVKQLLTWRVGVQWYVFVLLWPIALSLLKTYLAVGFGSAWPDFSQPPFLRLYPLPAELLSTTPFLAFLPVVFLQQLLVGSSMGEEPGWRGYALPRLLARYGSLQASLILGFVWSVWHFPLWLTKGNAMQETFLGWSVLGLVATTILFTWVYNHTQGSLFLALLFHTSIAISGLFVASADTHPLVEVAINWIAVAIIIRIFGPKLVAGSTS